MTELRGKLATLLCEARKAMWDGITPEREDYRSFSFVCHAIEHVAQELEYETGMCFREERLLIDYSIKRNLSNVIYGLTIGSACSRAGIRGNQQIQSVRKEFLHELFVQLIEQGKEYPDNLTLRKILEKFR